jgi:L-amino acid N-acyltransferase YncA
MLRIWNEVVEEGAAFPQEDCLDMETGAAFFASQSFTGVAEENGEILGLYILHPNNVGRCGHIANASYAVSSSARGRHVGEALVKDSMARAAELGFRILQFNAVVEGNARARRLYERLGFVQLGTIPGGFRMKDGRYVSICPYYRPLGQPD